MREVKRKGGGGKREREKTRANVTPSGTGPTGEGDKVSKTCSERVRETENKPESQPGPGAAKFRRQ